MNSSLKSAIAAFSACITFKSACHRNFKETKTKHIYHWQVTENRNTIQHFCGELEEINFAYLMQIFSEEKS